MADRVVGCHCEDVVDAREIIHTVAVGDVLFAAQQVKHRGVNRLEALLLRHRHTRHRNLRIHEETAVADHQAL